MTKQWLWNESHSRRRKRNYSDLSNNYVYENVFKQKESLEEKHTGYEINFSVLTANKKRSNRRKTKRYKINWIYKQKDWPKNYEHKITLLQRKTKSENKTWQYLTWL